MLEYIAYGVYAEGYNILIKVGLIFQTIKVMLNSIFIAWFCENKNLSNYV